MQSIAFVDAMQQQYHSGGALVVPTSSKSPVFDFDDVWADHVLALRNTAKASLGDAGWPVLLPMEGVSPTAMHHLGVKPEEYSQAAAATAAATTHWPTFSTGAPVALQQQLGGDGDGWTTTNSASSTYGAMFPNTTFGGYMMPIDQTSSTTSVSTLESPRSSRGSKRPPSTDDDEYEDSPLEFASSKAKRPRFDVNPSFSFSSSSFSKSGSGVVIAPAAPANNAVFILDKSSTTKSSTSATAAPHMSLDGLDVEGFWETVQGPWELADIPPPPPSHHTNAFFPVRAMPPLQVPVPRLPQQIWSAAAALGSTTSQ